MIPIQKFTTKSQEALQKTHRYVFENNQDTIDPVHLLLVLAEQEDGVVLSILKKFGIDIADSALALGFISGSAINFFQARQSDGTNFGNEFLIGLF